MASSRKRYTSDEVIALFRATESVSEEDEQAEEAFSEYIGVYLEYLQDDKSPQEGTDNEDTGAAGVCTFVSPVQKAWMLSNPNLMTREEK